MSEDYKKLLEYIPYFANDDRDYYQWIGGGKDENGNVYLSHPSYDKKLIQFVDCVYDSGIMQKEYLSHFNSEIGSSDSIIDTINKTKDMQTLLAILTYFIRQERFKEGLWGQAAEDKIFLTILLKLQALSQDKQ